jgi:hypothetical protein
MSLVLEAYSGTAFKRKAKMIVNIIEPFSIISPFMNGLKRV